MLEQAITYYHELLDQGTAEATQAMLTEQLRAHNLFFGERPLTTVLRPRMMTRDQYTTLRHSCELVSDAARTLGLAMLKDPSLRAGLMLTPGEEALIAMDPGYEDPSAHSRMDTFLTVDGSSLQFVEYNAESPAAIAYQDELSEVFLQLPVMRQFAERYQIEPMPARHLLLETLLRTWRAYGGNGDPQIAILDWSGLPTRSEFLLFQNYFHQHGLNAVICTPDDLVYRDGTLYARNAESLVPTTSAEVPITFVYKRVLTSELLMHYGDEALAHPLMRAYADGKVCMMNSFRAKLLHKKSIFALLTDEAVQPMFSAEQQEAIARHVPWTRIVADGTTTYQGEQIDLVAFTRANRERLLLKPNDEYGGKGIVVGWESSADEWDRALKEAQQAPFVVQERVEIAYEDYPALIDGQVQIGRRLVDSDPFLFGTHCEGCLTRLSTVTLLNVTAGGGSTVPTFVIDES